MTVVQPGLLDHYTSLIFGIPQFSVHKPSFVALQKTWEIEGVGRHLACGCTSSSAAPVKSSHAPLPLTHTVSVKRGVSPTDPSGLPKALADVLHMMVLDGGMNEVNITHNVYVNVITSYSESSIFSEGVLRVLCHFFLL